MGLANSKGSPRMLGYRRAGRNGTRATMTSSSNGLQLLTFFAHFGSAGVEWEQPSSSMYIMASHASQMSRPDSAIACAIMLKPSQ